MRHDDVDHGGWSRAAGLALGAAGGGLAAGWTGAVIGAYLGAFAAGDLIPSALMAVYQIRHGDEMRRKIDYHGLPPELLRRGTAGVLGILLTSSGVLLGGVVGYLLGYTGFTEAAGVFVGMALGGVLAGCVSTLFTRVDLPGVFTVGAGHLLVGATTWGIYSLWSTALAAALGILLGMWGIGLIGRIVYGT